MILLSTYEEEFHETKETEIFSSITFTDPVFFLNSMLG